VLNNLRTVVGEVLLINLNMKVIDEYKTKQLAEVTGVTVNVELRSLRTMMNIAVRWGMLEKNPFSGMKLVSIAEKALRFLTLEEYKNIYYSISEEWLKNVVLFAVMTGARRAEIVHLRWSDIDLNRKVASFESRGGFRVKAGKRAHYTTQ
jgi:integrase